MHQYTYVDPTIAQILLLCLVSRLGLVVCAEISGVSRSTIRGSSALVRHSEWPGPYWSYAPGWNHRRSVLEGSRRSSSHIACRLVNSLGNTSLDPVVREFLVRSSHRLGLCRRSRGLIGIGSGVGWVSGMAGGRWGVLGSA